MSFQGRDIAEQYPKLPSGVLSIEQIAETVDVHLKDRKWKAYEIWKDVRARCADFVGVSEPVDGREPFTMTNASESIHAKGTYKCVNCIGGVMIGNGEDGNRHSFMYHASPEVIFDSSVTPMFRKGLLAQAEAFKEITTKGTRISVTAGGVWDDFEGWRGCVRSNPAKEYLSMMKLIHSAIYKVLQIPTVIVQGPKRQYEETGQGTDFTLDTALGQLTIAQPVQHEDISGCLYRDLRNQSKKWPKERATGLQ